LPSLAVFQWAAALGETSRFPLSLTLADYNPSVLHLVTLPNFVLSWALLRQGEIPLLQEALSGEEEDEEGGELELSDEVKAAFLSFLGTSKISLSFVSGGWSPEFVELLYDERVVGAGPSASSGSPGVSTLVVGAETIYSPFALGAFADTLLEVLRRERSAEQPGRGATSIVAAKRLYFGVGGSLDDFVDRVSNAGADVRWLREETEGVRRGVVQCSLP
jgi:protein-histidine N-methyltransferase